ncbi:dbd5b000-593c-4a48-8067-d156caf8cf24 [Sclerotinia trifoliorum]|uniref:Dbd5b000-593c-4a48-8067-d156caf8cf24 n=1 Tax=Sclerotinia trifoliorum TaxID=28548 RepID=A0A8H2ZNH8_9HELO|nr:dbd5b000-593c-4a48-8067-d156caf8cf24 [Sclerotinia trifoliorum]
MASFRDPMRSHSISTVVSIIKSLAPRYFVAEPGLDLKFIHALLSSKIVILSSLGLEALINKKTENLPNSQDADIEYGAALVEAARGGHQETVDTLLQCFKPTKATLELSARSADYRVLFTLLKCISGLLERHEFSTELSYKVTWLGLDDAVEYLIEQDVAIDFETLPKNSPLHHAVMLNYERITKILISAKADINRPAQHGVTPLHKACMNGSLESVKLLLEAKANTDCKSEAHLTPLQVAAIRGGHEIIKILLSFGADKSYRGEATEALMFATENGFSNCCRVLLEDGAPTTLSDDYCPPLWWACRGDSLNEEMCELLLEYGADPNWEPGYNNSPILIEAVRAGCSVDLVKFLLKKGADINAVDAPSKYKTPVISTAARLGHTEIVKLLVERKADINLADFRGEKPICFAARGNYPEIVQILVDSKADIEMDQNLDSGCGPLHARFGFPKVVRILLKNGADINRNCSGGTILFFASMGNHIEVVELCLQYKPDLETIYLPNIARFYSGQTAPSVAMHLGNTGIVRLLLEAGANINHQVYHSLSPLHYGCLDPSLPDEHLRAILEYRPYLNILDDDGCTALHCIFAITPLSRIKLLVNAGADIEIRNKSLVTPLGIAIQCRNVDAVEYLLSKNTQVNLTGGPFVGALSMACFFLLYKAVCARSKTADDDQLPMVSYLLDDAKANINASAGWMGYALNMACLYGDSSLVKLLLNKGAQSDVVDLMGRRPIHLAALCTIDHWNLLAEDKLLETEDQLKRIPLHYAVASGRVDLTKAVLERSIAVLGPTVVNYPDCDNWTPIMWAARTCVEWGTTTNEQPEIIKLLLSNGANLWVKGDGLDRAWSPLRAARYYGAPEEVIELLTTKAGARSLNGEKWTVGLILRRKLPCPSMHSVTDVCFKLWEGGLNVRPARNLISVLSAIVRETFCTRIVHSTNVARNTNPSLNHHAVVK